MVRPKLRPGQGPRGDFFSGGSPGQAVENKPIGAFSPVPAAPLGSARYNGAVAVVTRDLNIRDFKPEDFDTLWRLDQECFPPGISYSRQELKAYIRHRGSFTLVASRSEGGTIAGFIVAHGPTGHIVTIDVIAAARRSGVGSLLLQAAEERLRDNGCHAVSLETAVDNVAALAFYKRHGYSVIRTWPRYYSDGVDALVLTKKLAASP